MAITNKEQGVWSLDQVYNKQMEGDIWEYTAPSAYFAWGYGDGGRLGLNDTASRSSPHQISGTDWSRMGSGAYGVGGIKTDGTLWAWGYNATGLLGLNDQMPWPSGGFSSPRQVGTDTTWPTNVKQLSTGYNSSGAIKTDGTLWTWGSNEH